LSDAEPRRIVIELSEAEAEWLSACMGLVLQLARHWDDRTANDMSNRVATKIALGRLATLNPCAGRR
jgi:hypothetical protein